MVVRVGVAEAEARVWARVRLDPIEHRVPVTGVDGTVRVLEVGDGPPALFVHGASVAAATWADLAAGLPGVRCLLLDRPGCGGSAPYTTRVAVDTFPQVASRLVTDVLDGLGIERAHLVGTSLGGFHALRTAAAHPGRVDRLVLIAWVLGTPGAPAPGWLRMGSHPVMARLGALVPPTEPAIRSMLSRFGLRRAITEGGLAPEALAWLVALYRDTPTLRNETVDGPRLLTVRHGWDEGVRHPPGVLASVRAPTLAVFGEEDPFGSVEAAEVLTSSMADATLHVVPRAGHAPWLDAPDEVRDLVAGFLAT